MKLLLFYPNSYCMNMLPTSIGPFISILRNEGHKITLFDTCKVKGRLIL